MINQKTNNLSNLLDVLREKLCKQQNKHLVKKPDIYNICMMETYCTLCGVKLIMDENYEYVAMDNGIIDSNRQKGEQVG